MLPKTKTLPTFLRSPLYRAGATKSHTKYSKKGKASTRAHHSEEVMCTKNCDARLILIRCTSNPLSAARLGIKGFPDEIFPNQRYKKKSPRPGASITLSKSHGITVNNPMAKRHNTAAERKNILRRASICPQIDILSRLSFSTFVLSKEILSGSSMLLLPAPSTVDYSDKIIWSRCLPGPPS